MAEPPDSAPYGEVPLRHGFDQGKSPESEASDPGHRGGVWDPASGPERLPEPAQGRDAATSGRADATAQSPLPEVDEVVTVRQLRALIQQETSWSGPLPDPETLERYERVLPGAADRIMRSLESQTVDASQRDDRIADTQIVVALRGQGWAVFLALLCIVAAIVFFAKDQLIAGGPC